MSHHRFNRADTLNYLHQYDRTMATALCDTYQALMPTMSRIVISSVPVHAKHSISTGLR